jgi:mono/diheme cytochrome c family protein
MPLLMLVGAVPPKQGAVAARRFSPLGLLCVTILTATALAQGWILIGGLPGLIGTDYGLVALAKLTLFLILIAIGATNRLRYTPALDSSAAADAKRGLRRSIALEVAIGLLVVLAAALLAGQVPGMHEQPVWPFAWRLSLENINEPDLGSDAIGGLVGLAGAAGVLCIGLIWRPAFMVALAAAALIVIWVTPNLELLFVQAYPTSFYRSPTGFAATTIVQGAGLYSSHCASCHGTSGRGDGPAAKSLRIPPADLTAQHLWAHSDGDLFWWLSYGIDGPKGGLAMPGFADTLPEEDRWALIDYVRANNSGLTMAATGQWRPPMLAPDFSATCTGGRMVTVADLRGRVVLILASMGDKAISVPPQLPTPLTITQLTRDAQARPMATACVATDPSVWTAYAIVSGVDPNSLDGTQFLVDPQGWLRARWRPGDADDWTDPRVLQVEIEKILANRIATGAGGGHTHHH